MNEGEPDSTLEWRSRAREAEQRLQDAQAEIARLREENSRSRETGGFAGQNQIPAMPQESSQLPPPPGSPSYLAERIARVEAAIEGLRHSQNLTIMATVGVGGLISAFVIGFGIYTMQRIDAVDSKIDAKFDALNARLASESAQTRQELIGLVSAISNSISAARQLPPPVPPSK